MKYESPKTEKGNVGVSFSSMEAAINQAEQMDKNYCNNCSNCNYCYNCNNCNYCYDCTNCNYCNYCNKCNKCYNNNDCNYCNYCYNCNNCNYCNDCNKCYNCNACNDCNDCNDSSGILGWKGYPATRLVAITGLTWLVATDHYQIQIGCQLHTVELWENFGDGEISCMDKAALKFWSQYKPIILALAKSGTKIPVPTKDVGEY